MVNTRSGNGYSSASGGVVGLTSSQAGSIGLGPKSYKVTKSQGSGSGGAGGGKKPQKTAKAGSKQTRCQPCVDLHRPCDRARPVCSTCERLLRPTMCVWPDLTAAPNSAMRRLQAQNIPAAPAALVAPAPAAAPANVPQAPAPQPQADEDEEEPDAEDADVAGAANFGDLGYFDDGEQSTPQRAASPTVPSNGPPTEEELAALDAAAPYEQSPIYFQGDSDNE